MDTVIIKLPDFEGPIELLWALVHKNELDVCALDLKNLINQLMVLVYQKENHFDIGAESIAHASNLLWIKSRALLPKEEPEETSLDDPASLQISILQKLVEYCRFKEAASLLSLREEKLNESFVRPAMHFEGTRKPFGIEHVSLSELAAVFHKVLEKTKHCFKTIEGEEWCVSDKMQQIRIKLQVNKIAVNDLFSFDYTKLELIVLFLAVLELMKLNEIRVVKDQITNQMAIIPYG